jgi:hypothetical protein
MNLQDQVDALGIQDWRRRAIVHLLIDTGRVTVLECQADDCPFEDRSFAPGNGRQHAQRQIGIHHIVARCAGGGERPDNLTIVHRWCNSSQPRPWKRTPEQSERHRAAIQARRARGEPVGGTARALDWQQECALVTAWVEGATGVALAEQFGVSQMTVSHVIRRRPPYGQGALS